MYSLAGLRPEFSQRSSTRIVWGDSGEEDAEDVEEDWEEDGGCDFEPMRVRGLDQSLPIAAIDDDSHELSEASTSDSALPRSHLHGPTGDASKEEDGEDEYDGGELKWVEEVEWPDGARLERFGLCFLLVSSMRIASGFANLATSAWFYLLFAN